MNTRTLKTWASVVLCGSMLAGCASLEERLASNDPATKREAETELISQSRRSPKLEDRIAAIKRVTDESVLLSAAISARGPYVPDGEYVLTKLKGENNFVAVVNSAQDPRIRRAAFAKIDNQAVFEKLAVGASDSGIRAEAFKKLTSQDSILKVASQTSDTAIKIAAIDKVTDKSKLLPIVFKKSAAPAVSKVDIQRTMMAIMRDRRMSDAEKKQKMAGLNAMANGGSASFDNAVVDAFIAKCNEKEVLLKVIADYGEVLTADQCAKLVANNSDEEVKNAIGKIADKKLYTEFQQLNAKKALRDVGIAEAFNKKAVNIKDPKMLADIVLAEIDVNLQPDQIRSSYLKFARSLDSEILVTCLEELWKRDNGSNSYYYQTCMGNIIGDFRGKPVKDALAKFPDRLAKVCALETIVAKTSFDDITPEVAAKILSSGVKLKEKVECSLAKKVAPNDITMAMFNAIPYDSVRKILQAKMPSNLKSELAAGTVAAAKPVMEKAKAAAKTTFSLDGFYLGMTAGDAKTMLAYHFPDFTFSDGEDILGKPFILVSGQKTPFCFIDKTSGTVYEFNFGKKMVEKWYKYDVQNALEWAMAFGRANNAKMVLNAKMEETKVYDADGQRSYPAWLLQERYTHKDNAKKYRITYHGEHKIKCGQSGIASTIIENEAYKDFWHCSADEGALKVTYED